MLIHVNQPVTAGWQDKTQNLQLLLGRGLWYVTSKHVSNQIPSKEKNSQIQLDLHLYKLQSRNQLKLGAWEAQHGMLWARYRKEDQERTVINRLPGGSREESWPEPWSCTVVGGWDGEQGWPGGWAEKQIKLPGRWPGCALYKGAQPTWQVKLDCSSLCNPSLTPRCSIAVIWRRNLVLSFSTIFLTF
jgi:hypothetical protein